MEPGYGGFVLALPDERFSEAVVDVHRLRVELEIDLENGLWTIPAERMKAAEEHVVPLSGAALEILTPLSESRLSEYVFPGQKPGKPLSGMAMEMLLRRLKVEDATVHGFRSSFRDWCGDETTFPREVAEAALAHKVGSEVERAYRRGKAIEKRRNLMEAWALFAVNSPQQNVVVNLYRSD